MYVYAGIDEAGYGPLLGPLLVGRAVMAIPALASDAGNPPQLWKRLSRAVCRNLTHRKGRIAVNDSKKLHSQTVGLTHLERGVLSFAALAGHQPADVGQWLDVLGETSHRELDHLPWYAPAMRNWEPLPCTCTAGEIAVARGLLTTTAKRIGVEMLDLGAAVVFEDRFNRMVSATRSKAAASFTFVGSHLQHIWEQFGEHDPFVAVDRQSGRTHYREPLALMLPEATMTVLEEGPEASAYRLQGRGRAMTVRFEVEAELQHMPVALASMISKYTRELLMNRFNAWFTQRAPHIKPTAGYAQDGRRFLNEITPILPQLKLRPEQLARIC